MRNPLGSILRIGVSRRGITVLRVHGHWRAGNDALLSDMHLPQDTTDLPALMAIRLPTALADKGCTSKRAHIVLADDLVRYFTVVPPKNAGSLRDCHAAAQMRFRTLYGETSADAWRIDADWHAREPFVACAVPAPLLLALQNALVERRIVLMSVVPQFIAAWNQWRAKLRGDAWFGVAHEHGMTIGAIHQRTLHAVRALAPLADGADLSSVPTRLAREALLLNLPAPARLQLTGSHLTGWNHESPWEFACERMEGSSSSATHARSEGIALAMTGWQA